MNIAEMTRDFAAALRVPNITRVDVCNVDAFVYFYVSFRHNGAHLSTLKTESIERVSQARISIPSELAMQINDDMAKTFRQEDEP